jgi:tetratricopeptide (TPR) repeat protein
MLGELYALTGKWEQAALHLARAVESRPHLRLRYATALDAMDKKLQAADQAKLAASFYRTRAEADIKDKAARGNWAEALAFQQDYAQAMSVLRDGFHLTGDIAYRPAMARVCLAWHLNVAKNKPDDVAQQWNLLQNGLELDSTNPQLLDRLMSYLGRGGKDADKARALIQGTLAKGEATATTHFLLGMDAWERDDKKEALVHWEQANKLSPTTPVIANNLAALLALQQKPDLPRALKLIDLVVEQVPNNPVYRETRGQIYIKMEKWREALTDLEMALTRDPNFPGLHASLAEVYARLEVPALAAEHRRLAEALEKKRKAATN